MGDYEWLQMIIYECFQAKSIVSGFMVLQETNLRAVYMFFFLAFQTESVI